MRFEEAFKLMREGKKVTRECWEAGTYLFISEEKKVLLMAKVKGVIKRTFWVNNMKSEALFATDWMVYDV